MSSIESETPRTDRETNRVQNATNRIGMKTTPITSKVSRVGSEDAAKLNSVGIASRIEPEMSTNRVGEVESEK